MVYADSRQKVNRKQKNAISTAAASKCSSEIINLGHVNNALIAYSRLSVSAMCGFLIKLRAFVLIKFAL